MVMPQNLLTGRLTSDEDGSLPYATVALQGSDSMPDVTMTDTLGYFRFDGIGACDYLLAFSMLGYKPDTLSVTVDGDTDVGTVVLARDGALLDEVTVSGRTFIRQKDKLLIIPDKVSVKHAATGYDLLANLMIPGVDVDRRKGQVTRFGNDVALYHRWQESRIS